MIGVIHKPGERVAVEEFFQLFKTPWEPYVAGHSYDVVIITTDAASPEDTRLALRFGVPKASRSGSEVRLAFDLFGETLQLLTEGQSVATAQIPTLDLRVKLVRDLILEAGIPLVEIPPTPAGYAFAACLTHDIDFIGIRRHRFDHTMWGFLYRSTFGALREFVSGRIGFGKLLRIWKAAASLPLVQLGLAKDFWVPFDWYLEVEKGLPATYYFIPFKGRAGEKVSTPHADRRASSYDVADIPEWIEKLKRNGCEVGVHGIDAWHSAAKGREERQRVNSAVGIRMHWLLRDAQTSRILEEAGYTYDSTVGYNETVGFRAGTTQVYLPPGNQTMLELPMHIQDGALFYPQRLGLSEPAAWALCEQMIGCAQEHGGVLTLLWHDRSHGPERFWGEFYARLVARLKDLKVWIASAQQVVEWFRARREVVFTRTELVHGGDKIHPPLAVRVYAGGKQRDVIWDGGGRLDLREFIDEEALAAQ